MLVASDSGHIVRDTGTPPHHPKDERPPSGVPNFCGSPRRSTLCELNNGRVDVANTLVQAAYPTGRGDAKPRRLITVGYLAAANITDPLPTAFKPHAGAKPDENRLCYILCG